MSRSSTSSSTRWVKFFKDSLYRGICLDYRIIDNLMHGFLRRMSCLGIRGAPLCLLGGNNSRIILHLLMEGLELLALALREIGHSRRFMATKMLPCIGIG